MSKTRGAASYAELVRSGSIHGSFSDEPTWKRVIEREAQKAIVAEMIDKGIRNGGAKAIINEMLADQVHKEGGLNYFEFPGSRRDPARPIIREMIDTSQGQMALLEKVRIDVAFGLADIPLLYGPLYQRIAPPGGFPGGLYQVDEFTLQANVVFLQKFEGGEVEFGTLQKGSPAVGAIQTYAAGFEWTEDMIEFDRTWSLELNSQAFGRAYNALLNHLHLSPIIGASYGGSNSTPANTGGSTTAENTHLTFQDAYTESVLATPRRTGTVLLASEADRFQIEEAILTPVYDANGQPLPNVPIQTIIYYDGETIERGSDVFEYPGVTPGTCFLIFPQRKLKELVHHDLRIDIGPPDISRLVEGQQVGRARRGVFANLDESVEKITLP
jgi:hypothetical protein